MRSALTRYERKTGNVKEDAFYPQRHLSFFRIPRARSSITKMRSTLFSSDREMKKYRKRPTASRIFLNLTEELEYKAQLPKM